MGVGTTSVGLGDGVTVLAMGRVEVALAPLVGVTVSDVAGWQPKQRRMNRTWKVISRLILHFPLKLVVFPLVTLISASIKIGPMQSGAPMVTVARLLPVSPFAVHHAGFDVGSFHSLTKSESSGSGGPLSDPML